MSEKEIVKKNDNLPATATPDFLASVDRTGFEGLDAGAQALPFLKILQPQSNEVMEGHDEHVEGAKAGSFFNSLTRELYGKTLDLILVYSERVYLEWKPDMGGFVGQMTPLEAEKEVVDKKAWPWENADGNQLVETVSFYCLIADRLDHGPIIFSCSGTMLGIIKRFISRLRLTKLDDGKTTAPSYAFVYHFQTEMNTNDKGTWFNVGKGKTDNINRDRYITADEYAAVQEALDLVVTEGIDYTKVDNKEPVENKPF